MNGRKSIRRDRVGAGALTCPTTNGVEHPIRRCSRCTIGAPAVQSSRTFRVPPVAIALASCVQPRGSFPNWALPTAKCSAVTDFSVGDGGHCGGGYRANEDTEPFPTGAQSSISNCSVLSCSNSCVRDARSGIGAECVNIDAVTVGGSRSSAQALQNCSELLRRRNLHCYRQ
jgi:hypothetical protein